MTEQMTAAAAPWSPHYTEPETVDVGGLEVAYRRKGTGPATVFLHGAGMTRMWLPVYERLSGGVDLIAPEHPGFGDTDAPDWLEGFDDLLLHYRDLLDALELDRVHLVGFSLGGWIAANIAIFYPSRLKSLTLISPAGLRVPEAPMTDFLRMPLEQIGDLLLNGQVADYLDYFPDPGDLDAAIRGYVEFSTVARLIWNPRYDYRLDRRVPRISLPALVLEPDDDRIVPNAHAKRWAELLPNARLEQVSGAAKPTGHLLMVQEPDRTAETILRFVQEVEG
jgi:pimeloyl-ACP methyl ester carboxylesterase